MNAEADVIGKFLPKIKYSAEGPIDQELEGCLFSHLDAQVVDYDSGHAGEYPWLPNKKTRG